MYLTTSKKIWKSDMMFCLSSWSVSKMSVRTVARLFFFCVCVCIRQTCQLLFNPMGLLFQQDVGSLDVGSVDVVERPKLLHKHVQDLVEDTLLVGGVGGVQLEDFCKRAGHKYFHTLHVTVLPRRGGKKGEERTGKPCRCASSDPA